MTVRRVGTGLPVVIVALCGAMAAGCAQPGQLGSAPIEPPAAVPAAQPAGPPTPEPTAAPGPQVLATGQVDSPVTIRTRGPAQFSVRTLVVAAGASTGWLRNPGTQISTVSAGGVVLQRAAEQDGSCDETPYGAGQAFFIPDATPYLLRNDGSEPVALTVTRLFAPDFPDPESVPAPC